MLVMQNFQLNYMLMVWKFEHNFSILLNLKIPLVLLCLYTVQFSCVSPCSLLIFIIVAPQILPFDFGEESVNSGDLASVTCSVHKGDLPLNITWLHNNQTIGYKTGIMVSKVGKKISTLSIDSVQAEHSGVYTCLAANRAGDAFYSAKLHVNGTFSILFLT